MGDGIMTDIFGCNGPIAKWNIQMEYQRGERCVYIYIYIMCVYTHDDRKTEP